MSDRTIPPGGRADASLDRLLDRLPQPQMPGDLAARIVRDVTRLPQFTADVEPTPAPIVAERLPEKRQDKVVAIGSAPPRRRWLAWTGGGVTTALAASLAALMLLPEATRQQPAPVVATAPRPVTAPMAAMADAESEQPPAPASPLASAKQPAPRLAEAAQPPAPAAPAQPQPEHSASQPVKITLPALEMAESQSGETPGNASALAEEDTALPDTELAVGNMGTPGRTGQAPTPQQGWGYAPGTVYTPSGSASRPDDDPPTRHDPGRGTNGRRF